MRKSALPLVAALLIAHALAAVGVWSAARAPERAGRLIEAQSGALTQQAELELRAGIEVLSDRSRASAERFAGYNDKLRAGRELLVRSLEVNPAQADVLATLATVDYELDPTDRATHDLVMKRIETAATLAPRVPRVQAKLGELLLRLGYADVALDYLARSAELDGTYSDRAVRLAAAYGLSVDAIRGALPHHAAALTALRQAYATDSLDEYMNLVEAAIEDGSIVPTPEILSAYADAALEIDQAPRMAERMTSWGPYAEPDLEAVRLMQQARAALAQGNRESALELAKAGQALDPDSQRLAGFLGDTARAAGRPEVAIRAYRHGLGLLARGNSSPQARAFQYRRIGEAQEDRHRMDLAYDAYAKALELYPDEPHARRRIRALAPNDGF